MSSEKQGKDKGVLGDKQKFGEHHDDQKLEHDAKDKLEHMGERADQASKPGSHTKK